MDVTLAVIYHDPKGRLYEQLVHVLPVLTGWPLFILRAGGFSHGYIATEGLEFETADRHGDGLARAGGRAKWLTQLDADPRQWAHRLNLASTEIEGMLPYVQDSIFAAS